MCCVSRFTHNLFIVNFSFLFKSKWKLRTIKIMPSNKGHFQIVFMVIERNRILFKWSPSNKQLFALIFTKERKNKLRIEWKVVKVFSVCGKCVCIDFHTIYFHDLQHFTLTMEWVGFLLIVTFTHFILLSLSLISHTQTFHSFVVNNQIRSGVNQRQERK